MLLSGRPRRPDARETTLIYYKYIASAGLHTLAHPMGWSGGVLVPGKLPVPGRPAIWMTVGQGPNVLAVGAGCLDIFTLVYSISPLSPSLWETARYRLKYCLKEPLNPNQPANLENRKQTLQTQIRLHIMWRLISLHCLPLSPKQPTNQPTGSQSLCISRMTNEHNATTSNVPPGA